MTSAFATFLISAGLRFREALKFWQNLEDLIKRSSGLKFVIRKFSIEQLYNKIKCNVEAAALP